MNDEVRDKVRASFNQSRLAVYRDEGNQNAFLRAAAGVLRIVKLARHDNRNHPDWPKLEPGHRFDSHEINASKVLVANLIGSWFKIFERVPSGKKNSVFFNVVNDLLAALGMKELGEAALKSMLSKS